MQTPLAGVQARTTVSYLAHWVRNEDDACLHEVHKTCCAGTPGCVAVPGVVDWPSPHCRIRFVLRRIAQRAANNYKARARRPPREGRSGSTNPSEAHPSTARSLLVLATTARGFEAPPEHLARLSGAAEAPGPRTSVRRRCSPKPAAPSLRFHPAGHICFPHLRGTIICGLHRTLLIADGPRYSEWRTRGSTQQQQQQQHVWEPRRWQPE